MYSLALSNERFRSKEAGENFSFSLALTVKAKAKLKIISRGKERETSEIRFSMSRSGLLSAEQTVKVTQFPTVLLLFFFVCMHWWLRYFVVPFKLHKEAHRATNKIPAARDGVEFERNILCYATSQRLERSCREQAKFKDTGATCRGDECTFRPVTENIDADSLITLRTLHLSANCFWLPEKKSTVSLLVGLESIVVRSSGQSPRELAYTRCRYLLVMCDLKVKIIDRDFIIGH